MKKQLPLNKIDNKKSAFFANIIKKLQTKKKRYSFQVLKQFILFPDESDSSQKTVSKYDRLIFSDEQIHTMFKKIQTKIIEGKIWAFLNIKYYRCLQAVKKLQKPLKKIQTRIQKENKQISFISIKTYSQLKTNKQKKTVVSTHTQVERPQIFTPSISTIYTPRRSQRSPRKIQINLDIRYEFEVNTPSTLRLSSQKQFQVNTPSTPRLSSQKSRQSSRGKVNVYYYQPPTIQPQAPLVYPLSQLHPSHIKQSVCSTQNQVKSNVRQSRLTANSRLDSRERSRSGSSIRYEYDENGSKRIYVNCKQVPLHYKLRRSQDSLKKEQQRYESGGFNNAQLQKRQNLKLEYQNSQNNYQSKLQSPRKYNENTNEREDLKPYCQICGQHHSNNLICSPKRSQKVIRLRSSLKEDKSVGYLQHLNG